MSKNRRKTAFKMAGIVVLMLLAFTGGLMLREGSGKIKHEHDQVDTFVKSEIWTCSMHPQIKQPEPGPCPICGMDLIPLKMSGGDELGERAMSMSEAAMKLAEVETEVVARRFVDVEIPLTGKIDYDETRVKNISSWVAGRLERLFVDYTGTLVKKGDRLVEVYSPELYAAQEELLQMIKTASAVSESGNAHFKQSAVDNVQAVREKLRLLGLQDEQIATIEKQKNASPNIEITAPVEGIVIHKNAKEGMYVQKGTPIYTVVDLSKLWIHLDVYESDLAWIKNGQNVEIKTESYGDKTFRGRVAFVDPILNPETRTVKVRVEVDNPEGLLKPNMFIKAKVQAHVGQKDEEPPIVLPSSAVLITGKRAIVYVRLKDKERPTFEGREIELGPRAGDFYIVQSGLESGEDVVVHGNFKIDSALQLIAKPSMMNPEERAVHPQQLCPVMGGKINPDVYTDYQGYRIYFCCAGCEEVFMEKPDQFIKEMLSSGIMLERTSVTETHEGH